MCIYIQYIHVIDMYHLRIPFLGDGNKWREIRTISTTFTAKTEDQDTGALEQKASSLAGTEVLRSGSLHLNPLLQVTLRDHQLTGGPPILGWDDQRPTKKVVEIPALPVSGGFWWIDQEETIFNK